MIGDIERNDTMGLFVKREVDVNGLFDKFATIPDPKKEKKDDKDKKNTETTAEKKDDK